MTPSSTQPHRIYIHVYCHASTFRCPPASKPELTAAGQAANAKTLQAAQVGTRPLQTPLLNAQLATSWHVVKALQALRAAVVVHARLSYRTRHTHVKRVQTVPARTLQVNATTIILISDTTGGRHVLLTWKLLRASSTLETRQPAKGTPLSTLRTSYETTPTFHHYV